MNIDQADVIWTPGTNLCRVELRLSGWRRTYGDRWMHANSWGGVGQHTGGDNELLAMFVLFNTIVVRDGVDPQAAHNAFLAIDEYRKTISPDQSGAD